LPCNHGHLRVTLASMSANRRDRLTHLVSRHLRRLWSAVCGLQAGATLARLADGQQYGRVLDGLDAVPLGRDDE
jgi:hypothetical protein